MRTIYKYAIEATDDLIIEMPKGAIILTVQVQRGYPCIWAIIDTNAPMVRRHLKVFRTGHPMPATIPYIGTFQIMGGDLVFHLFDVGEL